MTAILAPILQAAHMPAAFMLGPLAAAIIVAAIDGSLRIPSVPFVMAEALIGCVIARSLQLPMLREISRDWPLFIAAVASVLIASSCLSWLLMRWRVLPGTTAIWGSFPGAAMVMILMSEAYGEDVRLVAFMQYLRIVCVALAASIVARLALGPLQHASVNLFPPVAWDAMLQTIAIAAIGAWLGPKLRMPAGALLLPMILAAILQDGGWLHIELPPWLLAASYAVIGWSIGARFTRSILIHAARAIPQVLLSTVALIIICGGIGYALVKISGVDPLTAFLATSPGGVDSVVIIAANSNVNLPFIVAMQTARFILIILAGPAMARFLGAPRAQSRMITVYSADHMLRHPRTELSGGELVTPHECPERAQFVLDRVQAQRLGEVIAPTRFGAAPLLRVHDAQYLQFLECAWSDWVAAGNRGEAIPDCWPARRMTQKRPNSVAGKLGFYAMAGETSISAGTWQAACAAADTALTGAAHLKAGAPAAFALCRPPGHHAAHDLFGGYCFLNNAAVATQFLRDGGAQRVAILDVDFHHGNGTQDIFYARDDVLFVSLHAHPADAFPYFSGYEDETGSGAGSGFTYNLPMPEGTEFGLWQAALRSALRRIAGFGADALIISLGVDTFIDDPISSFRLRSEDFLTYGRMIGACSLPTLFVLEGGYAVREIGINVVNVLTGFEDK